MICSHLLLAQSVTTKCFSGSTQSFDNTAGTLLPAINFTAGVDIPVGHTIVDVTVEIVWSRSDLNSRKSPRGIDSNMEEIGFILSPLSGKTQYLATSSSTAGFPVSEPTTNSFAGIVPGAQDFILHDTIVFKDA